MRKFILDTDWWTDCDDAVAIRLLCNAHIRKEIEVLGININACMEFSIPSLDVFTRDCGVSIPLAIDHSAVGFAGGPSYQQHLAASGTPLFQNCDVPESVDFYSELLKNASDDSIEILSIGFTQVFARMIRDPELRLLVAKKVKHLWIMAGKWDENGGKEYNFYKNEITRQSGSDLCAFWPTPITFLGYEVGESVISGKNLPDGDLLKQVMTDHGSVNGRSSWDPMLILLAIAGEPEKAGYKCVYGKASVNAIDGSNYFTEDLSGKHRFVIKLHDDSFYANEIDGKLPKISLPADQ